jgi:hypothetical protein
MSSHRYDAPDTIDNHLGRCLKNWVSTKTPPPDARGRLLEAASRQATQLTEKPSIFNFFSHHDYQDNIFHHLSHSYGFALQMGVMMR